MENKTNKLNPLDAFLVASSRIAGFAQVLFFGLTLLCGVKLPIWITMFPMTAWGVLWMILIMIMLFRKTEETKDNNNDQG